MSVAISNPSRKKERTDAKASDKEVVVSQMSKFVNKKDLERLFKPVCSSLLSYYVRLDWI